jgi:hypothetical protein
MNEGEKPFLGDEQTRQDLETTEIEKQQIREEIKKQEIFLRNVTERIEMDEGYITHLETSIEIFSDEELGDPKKVEMHTADLIQARKELEEDIAFKKKIQNCISELHLDSVLLASITDQLQHIQDEYKKLMTRPKPGQEN